MIRNLNFISETICLLVSVYVFFKQNKNNFILQFSLYLFCVLCLEVAARCTSDHNDMLINFTSLFILFFNTHIVLLFFNKLLINKVIKIAIAAYTAIWLYYYVMCNNTHTINIHILECSFFIQIVYSLLVFYNVLHNKKNDIQQNNTEFAIWYYTGLLIFNAGIVICFSLLNYIAKHKINLLGLPAYNTIPKLLCVVLYCCMAIALLQWKSQQNKLPI